MQVQVEPHPLLEPCCFFTTFPAPLCKLPSPPSLLGYFGTRAAEAPLQTHDTVKKSVRDLLRSASFKPTGRSKPASEYLLKALEKGWLNEQKSINLAVDVCNVVSLHSGLPISVIDADRANPPFSIRICPPDTAYVFNPSGQSIKLDGLLSLYDADGPCGGPVKDSQRTKTHEQTTRTLTVIWGTNALPGRTKAAFTWYKSLLEEAGATIEIAEIVPLEEPT